MLECHGKSNASYRMSSGYSKPHNQHYNNHQILHQLSYTLEPEQYVLMIL
jgi:hypothetical protein